MSAGYDDFDDIVADFGSPARAAMRAVTETSEATRRELDSIADSVDKLAAQRDRAYASRDWWADRCEELEQDLALAKLEIERLEKEIP